jgi:hypothetical protein
MKQRLFAIVFSMLILPFCKAADCGFPDDIQDQLAHWIFVHDSANITDAEVTLYPPRQVRVVVKNARGLETKRVFWGLPVEWVRYGDVDGEKGVLITAIYQGVFIIDRGKIISARNTEDVEWIDGKSQSKGTKIWVKRQPPNKSPEATPPARTPAADAPVAPAVGRASS